MTRSLHGPVLLAMCLLLSTDASWAAEVEPLFEDDFTELDGCFSPSDNYGTTEAKDNELVFRPTASATRLGDYPALFESVEVSARFRFDEPDGENGAYGALVVAKAPGQFVSFLVRDTGKIAIHASADGIFWYQMPAKTSPELKREAGAWNDLRIVVVGDRAAFFLNGKQVASMQDEILKKGGQVSLEYGAGASASVGRFAKLRIAEPARGAIKMETAANESLADDQFATLSPAWGLDGADFAFVRNGELVFKLSDQSRVRTIKYFGALAQDVDIRVKVQAEKTGKYEGLPAGGLMFWRSGDSDFAMYMVSSDARVYAFRLVLKDGKWQSLKLFEPRSAPDDAKFDSAGANELRVVTVGKKAQFYLNGIEVAKATNIQAPKTRAQFGLYMESGGDAEVRFSSFSARRPAAK